MDRTAPSEGADASSILAERTRDLLALRFPERFCEARFLARCGVFGNHSAFCRFIDRLISGRKRRSGFSGFSGYKKIPNILGRREKGTLTAHIEHALLERRSVGLLGGRSDCHIEGILLYGGFFYNLFSITYNLYYWVMIRQIRGKVLSVEPFGAVVEVAGFGIFVRVPSSETFTVGKETVLLTHLAVKQDGMELYGFASAADLGFFELVLSVPGVGPKTALSLLRRAPREALESAIAKRDVGYLTRVVGLSKKTAEKINVELSEKIGGGGAHSGHDAEVFDTLIALGYTEREARKALADIPPNLSDKDARLRAALSQTAR